MTIPFFQLCSSSVFGGYTILNENFVDIYLQVGLQRRVSFASLFFWSFIDFATEYSYQLFQEAVSQISVSQALRVTPCIQHHIVIYIKNAQNEWKESWYLFFTHSLHFNFLILVTLKIANLGYQFVSTMCVSCTLFYFFLVILYFGYLQIM